MAIRETYSDTFTGEADKIIRRILYSRSDDDAGEGKLRRILLKVIKNELTTRQNEIIMLYYFKNMNITEIAGQLKISPQAVSAAMGRARLRLFRILQYYIR